VSDPRIIAHRGFAGAAPENTLAAFRAVADGTTQAAMVELDVVPCADGTPVVFHDHHLHEEGDSQGLTDRTGVVWETPCEEVRAAEVLDTGETVPTLTAALDVLPPEIGVNVELKSPGTFDVAPGASLAPEEVAARREQWDPFVEAVVDRLDPERREVLVSSFCEPALAAVRDLAPDLPAAPLLYGATDPGLAVAERYGCEAIHPHVDLVEVGIGGDVPPDGLLATAADRGYAVNVWTVETWRDAERFAAAGVDGLIAEYPSLRAWTHA
jgi:glycerophosphoryl diester phosphodiesterase